jgi:hypothetical protein
MMTRSIVTMSLVLTAGVLVGLGLRSVHSNQTEQPGAEGAPGDGIARNRTISLSGSLSDSLTREFGRFLREDSVLVIAVSARDCFTCEDLGRQIRELASVVNGRMPIVVVMPEADGKRVIEFVQAERIRNVDLRPYRSSLKTDDGVVVPTPAAFILDRRGGILRGVAHLDRQSNVRKRSFAHELGFLPMGLVPLLRDSLENER